MTHCTAPSPHRCRSGQSTTACAVAPAGCHCARRRIGGSCSSTAENRHRRRNREHGCAWALLQKAGPANATAGRVDNQRLAKYIVTSKPMRRSVNAGLFHMGQSSSCAGTIPVKPLMHGARGDRMLLSKEVAACVGRGCCAVSRTHHKTNVGASLLAMEASDIQHAMLTVRPPREQARSHRGLRCS